MRLALLPLLALGCAGSTIELDPNNDGTPDVTIEQNFGGSGCIAVDASPGTTSIIVQQHGSSDWSISRAFEWIVSVVGSIFGSSQTGEQRGPEAGPGCEGLFVDEAVAVDGAQ